MSDLPSGWRRFTLRELGVLAQPGFASGAHSRDASGVPHLRPMNVSRTGKIDLSDVKYVQDATDRRVRGGDVLFNNTNSPVLVGKTAHVPTGEPLAFSNHMTRLRADPLQLQPRFLAYQLHFLWMTGFFKSICSNHVNQASVATKRLLQVEVILPPRDEQRRIIEILEDHLSRLDAAGAALNLGWRRLTAFEAAALAEVHRATDHLVSLAEVSEVQGGIQKQPKRAPQNNAFPFLRVANVMPRGLDLVDVHKIELFDGELQRYRLEPGDLLVVEGNGSPSQVGRAAMWDGSIADCVHQNHLIRVRPLHGLRPAYLEVIWNSPQNRRQLTAVASSTSGLHTLSVAKLKSLRVPLPSVEVQEAWAGRVSELREQRSHAMQAIALSRTRLSSLRRALLQAAFSGQLTGQSNDPNLAEELSDVVQRSSVTPA